MTSEQMIYEDFASGGLKFFDAVHLLEAIGYHFDDAEDLVSEWADGLEGHEDEHDDDEGKHCPYRHFTDEESAGWERVFADLEFKS